MKRIVTILLVVFSLTGCAGVSDWSYQLPNNYEVWRINSQEIIIKNAITQNNIDAISGFVKEFSYDSRYVFTRNVQNISDNNILNEEYYTLDTIENKVYGPFDSIEDLQQHVEEWGIKIPEKWYRTSPDPNM